MKFNLKPQTSHALVAAGLLLSLGAAHAASGFTVTPRQEAMIQSGMSADQVKQSLGRPAQTVQYHNEVGPTWSYEVVGALNESTLFDVDFGANGTVASVSERIVDNSH